MASADAADGRRRKRPCKPVEVAIGPAFRFTCVRYSKTLKGLTAAESLGQSWYWYAS